MVNLKSVSFIIILHLHEGLTHIQSQIKPWLHFGESFTLRFPFMISQCMELLSKLQATTLVFTVCLVLLSARCCCRFCLAEKEDFQKEFYEDSLEIVLRSLSLLRNLPLIFGDLVCPTDQYWYLFLLLLQIVNIVFSPMLSKGIAIFFKHLIAEHHRLFKHLYPNKRLLPKHHFMVHYPICILKIGPLLDIWGVFQKGDFVKSLFVNSC